MSVPMAVRAKGFRFGELWVEEHGAEWGMALDTCSGCGTYTLVARDGWETTLQRLGVLRGKLKCVEVERQVNVRGFVVWAEADEYPETERGCEVPSYFVTITMTTA